VSEETGDFEAPVGSRERSYRIEELPPARLRLSGAAASLDDLILTLEVALAGHDTTRLLDLMIDEREYREILYPAFPAAHPPINAGFETLWVTHFPDAYRGLMLLLGTYSAGLAVPFLVAAFAVEKFLDWFQRFRRYLNLVQRVSGVLLVIVGLLIATGQFTRLASYLQKLTPDFLLRML